MASKGKKSTPFQKSHALEYALEIVSTEANGDMTIPCKICLHEGRDVVEVGVAGRKSKLRSDIHYFRKPFAAFKHRNHHEGQHTSSWAKYKDLSVEEKKRHFAGRVKLTNTPHHHVDLATDTLQFFIGAAIVETTIVGDLFCRDDEQLDDIDQGEENAAKKQKEKANAMKLFVQQEDKAVYMVTIKDVLRLDLAMNYIGLGLGLSFRQTAAAIQKAKDRSKTAKLTDINDGVIGQYT